MPALLVLCMALWAAATASAAPGDELLYNQVQFIGTDQSYHTAPPQPIIDLLNHPEYQAVFAKQSLDLPEDYAFNHLTLTQMLNFGLRGFELDVLVDDPQGGKYAYSAGLKLAGQSNTLISPDLLKPGLKVFSSPDFDFGSTCYLFKNCLNEIKSWSAANPGHFPVTIFIHHGGLAKASIILGDYYATAVSKLQSMPGLPTNFTNGVTAKLTDIQTEILSVFSRDQLYTPQDLRLDNNAPPSTNLRDIVLPGGAANGSWPSIGRLRNKILFMGDPDYYTELSALDPTSTSTIFWLADDQGNQDPNTVVFDEFVDVTLGDTTALKPYPIVANAVDIVMAEAYGTQNVVLQGFFIRAGTDTSASIAVNDYTFQRDFMASHGGAQFLATLFEVPPPPKLINSPYAANPTNVPNFNGAEAICNPVTTSQGPISMGDAAFAADGAIPNLGGITIFQDFVSCSVPQGFSPGKYTTVPQPPAPAPSSPGTTLVNASTACPSVNGVPTNSCFNQAGSMHVCCISPASCGAFTSSGNPTCANGNPYVFA